MIVKDPGGTVPAETWGPGGQRFAILPIAGGQCYCYGTAGIPAGTAFEDDAAELRRHFDSRHAPISPLPTPLTRDDILRNDIEEMLPLPAMHRGRVARLGDAAHAMTPDLGQVACQASSTPWSWPHRSTRRTQRRSPRPWTAIPPHPCPEPPP